MQCIVCGDEFEGRKDAKYCSSKCRVKASRDKGGSENNIPQKNMEVKTKASTKPPKPDYLSDAEYKIWDGVECKWGACLDKDCKWRENVIHPALKTTTSPR